MRSSLETPPTLFLRFYSCCQCVTHCRFVFKSQRSLVAGVGRSCQMHFKREIFRGVNRVSEVATVRAKYCGNAHWRYFAFLAHELTIDFFFVCFSVRVTDGSPRGQRVRRCELSGGVFNLSNLSPRASRTPTLIV